jgi:hypothetical protein
MNLYPEIIINNIAIPPEIPKSNAKIKEINLSGEVWTNPRAVRQPDVSQYVG